jgi:hypothetical protein
MLRKIMAPFKRVDWEKISARAGSLLSKHQSKGLGALYAAAFALVVLLVHREVYAFIATRKQFTASRVEARVAPKWAGSEGVEVVRVGKDGTPIYDPGLVERVGRAFEECPWVRRVTAVERVFPDQLRVRYEYRVPHVAVKRANGYVIVDADGVRLPGVYVDPLKACARQVEVSGVATLPPEPGKIWNDPALKAGMALADFAAENPLLVRLKVREVDVSNFGGKADARRSEVAFTTSSGVTIAWGRAPGAGKFGEPSAQEKIENLREVLAVYPNLEGVRTVKVYFRGTRAVEPSDLVKKPK